MFSCGISNIRILRLLVFLAALLFVLPASFAQSTTNVLTPGGGLVPLPKDAARRQFDPTATVLLNQAASSPASWGLPAGLTLTTAGVKGPDGSTALAGRISNSNSFIYGPYFYPATNI